jgi:hypothetical protein
LNCDRFPSHLPYGYYNECLNKFDINMKNKFTFFPPLLFFKKKNDEDKFDINMNHNVLLFMTDVGWWSTFFDDGNQRRRRWRRRWRRWRSSRRPARRRRWYNFTFP